MSALVARLLLLVDAVRFLASVKPLSAAEVAELERQHREGREQR